jgi:hypothetical protein
MKRILLAECKMRPCTQCCGKPCAGMQWSAGFPKLAFAKVVILKVKGSARR